MDLHSVEEAIKRVSMLEENPGSWGIGFASDALSIALACMEAMMKAEMPKEKVETGTMHEDDIARVRTYNQALSDCRPLLASRDMEIGGLKEEIQLITAPKEISFKLLQEENTALKKQVEGMANEEKNLTSEVGHYKALYQGQLSYNKELKSQLIQLRKEKEFVYQVRNKTCPDGYFFATEKLAQRWIDDLGLNSGTSGWVIIPRRVAAAIVGEGEGV